LPDFTVGSEGLNLKSVAVRLTVLVPPPPEAALVVAGVAALLVLLSLLLPPQPTIGTANAAPIANNAANRRFRRIGTSTEFVG
jgi:hypothetical protein